jgi:medium-chain acyl-[acyl-carrier-protein] hydrolase
MNLTSVFPFRRQIASPRLRLICLPYAGGAASIYRPWVELFGTNIDVCPVELPGRGVRMAEPPIRDMQRLCASLAEAIDQLADIPLALFGHSMGARIAYELTCQLPGKVEHLFVSGSAAPEVPPRLGADHGSKPIAQLSDDEFRVRLRELGGTPIEILDNDELMERVLPAVRADFVLVERYRPAASIPLPVPITVFRGSQDIGVAVADAARWQLRSSAAFRFIEVPGGHFFLDGQRAAVTREVALDLASLAA